MAHGTMGRATRRATRQMKVTGAPPRITPDLLTPRPACPRAQHLAMRSPLSSACAELGAHLNHPSVGPLLVQSPADPPNCARLRTTSRTSSRQEHCDLPRRVLPHGVSLDRSPFSRGQLTLLIRMGLRASEFVEAVDAGSV